MADPTNPLAPPTPVPPINPDNPFKPVAGQSLQDAALRLALAQAGGDPAAAAKLQGTYTVLGDGTLIDGTGARYSSTQDAYGNTAFVPESSAAKTTSGNDNVASVSNLPSGFFYDPNGQVWMPGPDGTPVKATQADITRAAGGQAAAVRAPSSGPAYQPPSMQTVVNQKDGHALIFNPASGTYKDSGLVVQWPEIDPKLTNQQQVDQFDQTLKFNRDQLAQNGQLSQDQIASTEKISANNIAAQLQVAKENNDTQKFTTLANLVPQLAQQATDASKRFQDILGNGADVGFRLWSQRNGQSPFAMRTPADQINSLVTALQGVQKYADSLNTPTSGPTGFVPPSKVAPPQYAYTGQGADIGAPNPQSFGTAPQIAAITAQPVGGGVVGGGDAKTGGGFVYTNYGAPNANFSALDPNQAKLLPSFIKAQYGIKV